MRRFMSLICSPPLRLLSLPPPPRPLRGSCASGSGIGVTWSGSAGACRRYIIITARRPIAEAIPDAIGATALSRGYRHHLSAR